MLNRRADGGRRPLAHQAQDPLDLPVPGPTLRSEVGVYPADGDLKISDLEEGQDGVPFVGPR
jgi:hypothetical protein